MVNLCGSVENLVIATGVGKSLYCTASLHIICAREYGSRRPEVLENEENVSAE